MGSEGKPKWPQQWKTVIYDIPNIFDTSVVFEAQGLKKIILNIQLA